MKKTTAFLTSVVLIIVLSFSAVYAATLSATGSIVYNEWIPPFRDNCKTKVTIAKNSDGLLFEYFLGSEVFNYDTRVGTNSMPGPATALTGSRSKTFSKTAYGYGTKGFGVYYVKNEAGTMIISDYKYVT